MRARPRPSLSPGVLGHLSGGRSPGLGARAAARSASNSCKVFKRETGPAFTECPARPGVETVKETLLNPHKGIGDPSCGKGFQALSRFNRVSGHFLGETPSDCRKALQMASAA